MAANAPARSFRDSIEETLKHFNDPAWLGEHASLAAPYLLARYLDAKIDSPLARGRVLQEVIKQATAQLDGKQGKRSRDILEQYYFRNLRVDAVCHNLGLSNATFHVSRGAAIDSLAEALTREIQPALALDSPPVFSGELFGRTAERSSCLAALRQKQTVLILGSGGMGKTTLGSHLVHAWGERHVCWFTIRPGLTDHLSTLLLHLGFFFRQHDAPALWQEMIAAQAKIDPKIMVGLVRYIMEQDRPQTLLLCIDEIDLLQPAAHAEHEQLLVFLQSLRGLMPLLLIGQRSTLAADHYVTLGSLPPDALTPWLLHHRIRLAPEELAQLHRHTGGAPHLIELFITLQQSGEPLETLLQQLAAAPTLEALLGRVLQRLSDVERGLLMELAVMQAPTPTEIWRDGKTAGALRLLVERHLVQSDDYGRVWLLPAYRQLVLDALPAEKLAALHARAAAIFAERGQITVAAYHYARASQPETAIRLWREHQEQEINQGQAHAALQVFQAMPALDLPAPAVEELALILARLRSLLGAAAQAGADLRAILWRTPLLAVEADELSGVIANDQGEYATARQFFSSGLERAERLLETRIAFMRKGMAWSYVEEKDLVPAWKEAMLAAYEVENIKGLIQEEMCDYWLAETHFRAALTLAEELNHEQGVAKSSSNLSALYARLGRDAEAQQYGERAYALFLRLDKVSSVAGCKINMGFHQNLAGDFAAAQTTAQEVDHYLAERTVEAPRRLRSIIEQVKAEAALGLGELARAETCATLALTHGGDFIAADATRTLAEVHLRRGDLERAAALVEQAVMLAQADGDRYLEAYAWRVAAHIHQARCQPAAAARATATAIDIFTALNLPHEAARGWPAPL